MGKCSSLSYFARGYPDFLKVSAEKVSILICKSTCVQFESKKSQVVWKTPLQFFCLSKYKSLPWNSISVKVLKGNFVLWKLIPQMLFLCRYHVLKFYSCVVVTEHIVTLAPFLPVNSFSKCREVLKMGTLN